MNEYSSLEVINKKEPVKTLGQFYSLMSATRIIRSRIVVQHIDSSSADKKDIDYLRKAEDALKKIEHTSEGALLSIDDYEKTIPFDLSYEEQELHKDIIFLSNGEDKLYEYMGTIHSSFSKQIADNLPALKTFNFKNLISDRDGTTNNYCGRYLSSIQSVYNAVFLTRFARKCVNNAVLLTSAPLENGGMVDVNTMPDKTFIFAGSKGREYLDKSGKHGTYPIESEKQKLLDILNQQISELIQQPEFKKFSFIGSGFQQKFGQTTMARQDISKSISSRESNDFMQIIRNLVYDLDPHRIYFRIEDTGKDIEIILTIETPSNSDNLKDFDKGDGVDFLDDCLHLHMDEGPNLICGDTFSDISMVETSLQKTDRTLSIFVTCDTELQDRVQKLLSEVIFVDEPDTLVAVLNELSK